MTELLTATRRVERQQNAYTALSKKIKSEDLLRRSYGFYAGLTAALLTATAGLVVGSYLLGDSWWQLAVAVASALLLCQFGFLGHDAAHRQIFASGKHNDRAALIIANGLVGMSLGWWQSKHNRHHSAPNQIGTDTDIAPGPITFTAEGANNRKTVWGRWLTSKQGFFFFPILSLTALGLIADSVRYLLAPGPVKRRGPELALFLTRHALTVGFAFWVMSPAIALGFLLTQTLVFGFGLGMAFAPNHIGRPIVPRDTKVDFFRRQVLMSRNLPGTHFADFAFGGLNYQIEHHLFPSMSRPNLRRAAPIVAQYCHAIEVEYPKTSLLQAYVEVGRYINRIGWGGIDVWRCPLASAMGRS